MPKENNLRHSRKSKLSEEFNVQQKWPSNIKDISCYQHANTQIIIPMSICWNICKITADKKKKKRLERHPHKNRMWAWKLQLLVEVRGTTESMCRKERICKAYMCWQCKCTTMYFKNGGNRENECKKINFSVTVQVMVVWILLFWDCGRIKQMSNYGTS